ncbi:hypothetical protein [Fluviicola sp.]|jgi:hypothetical protein|uniref:hypothetical protein n=1 Tax=Fluviicola sp. TaxID=1917219 RepID=UPI00281A03BE|nr:hypothetical protein [Fluviicola sp.]MDR0801482.1 hypothetical protein [Fluviicola sp.]
MKTIKLLTLIFGLVLSSCNQGGSTTTVEHTENLLQIDHSKDKKKIQNLIRQVLKWADSKDCITTPVLSDSQDSIYTGFDLNKLQSNLDKLRTTGFFASEFIDNYNQIMLTLNRKLRNQEVEWLVGDLPPFGNTDTNPWCDCQDVPFDNPNPWDYVKIEIIELKNGNAQLIWKWGSPNLNTHPVWEEFSYRFKAVKENSKWKIAYLQGFDFDESTK